MLSLPTLDKGWLLPAGLHGKCWPSSSIASRKQSRKDALFCLRFVRLILIFEILCNPFASLLGAQFSTSSLLKELEGDTKQGAKIIWNQILLFLSCVSEITCCWAACSPGSLWWCLCTEKKKSCPVTYKRGPTVPSLDAIPFSFLQSLWMNLDSPVNLASCNVGKWKGFVAFPNNRCL